MTKNSAIDAISISTQTGVQSPKPKFRLLHFLLTSFVLLTISISFYSSHRQLRIYAESVRVNQEWAQRQARYNDLDDLAEEVNIAGNDVFHSYDADAESAKMHEALSRFNEAWAAAYADLKSRVSEAEAAPLLNELEMADGGMTDMATEADGVFSYFRLGLRGKAAERMAVMDNKHSEIHRNLATLAHQIQDIQKVYLDKEVERAHSFGKIEYVIGALIAMMVGSVAAHGKVTYRQVAAAAQEKERALAALRASEEHFRALIENAQDLIIVIDGDLRISYQSSSVEKVLGFTAEERIGKSALEFIHPNDLPGIVQTFQEGTSQPAYNAFKEFRAQHKDGSWRVLEGIGENLLFDPTVGGIVVNCRDVTERKQAEETLRESEALFRSLAETVSAAIFIYRDSKHVYLNPAAEIISGYTRDELMDMEVWDIVHPDFREQAKRRVALRQKGEDIPPRYETKIQTKNGEARWLDTTASPIRFHGQPAVLATAFDITERKGWEDTLRESEERYRTILESIRDGYYEVDLSGNLTFFNDSLSRIVGTPAAKMSGLNHRDYTDPETAARMRQAFNEVFRTGEPLERFEYEIVTLEGVRKFLETSVSLRRDSSGEIAGFRGTSRDITERKRAEEALRESEDRYRDLVEHSHDLICTHDSAGLILSVNQSVAKLIGYDREALLKMNLRDLLIPEFRRDFERYLDTVRTCGSAQGLMKIQTAAGQTRIIEYNNTLRTEGVAEPIVRAMAHDITERTQAETALRESQERYKTLFETASDSIMILEAEGDRAGNITAANRAAAELSGHTVEELLSLNIRDLLAPASAQGAASRIQRVLGGERLNFEVEQRRKDGTVLPVEVNAGLLTLGDKHYMLGFARDISRRKRAEKEVTMLAQAIRSIHEAVVVTDLDGNIIFVNAAAVGVYGYEPDEAIGKHVTILHSTRNSPEFVNEVVTSVRAHRWEGEMLSRRKDGTEFPIYLSASDIQDEKGQCIALIGVSQDITERKRSIAELQKAKEAAETASRAKSEFLANMSHEIRTPMNGIVGMTELALDTELTAEQREYLQLVKLSADSLLRVINDILDFSKIEAGKLELDLAEFSLQDSVDEVMKALGVRADQKGLELAYYLRPGVPDLIVGDSGRLRQILVNLVGNAIKFTERGEVVVRIETESQTDDHVVLHFCVRDTGMGVPIEKQAAVFESFTQADGSTTRKYGGTGLGLAISTQLVRAMDGQIWIESPSNCGLSNADCELENGPSDSLSAVRNLNSAIGGPGSMFHFTAAFALPRTSAARTASFELSTMRGLPALVVDDNATNRRILEVQLTGWGMKPATAADAPEALNAIRQAAAGGAPFRLTLLDLHMPDVDGLELTEQIRRMPEAADVKIIMMSSVVRENYSLQVRGIDAYLLKPVKASDLLGVIRTVLGKASLSQDGSKRPRATSSAHPVRVLVAEDNPVNQELLKRLLTKWGHSVVMAHDGKQVLSLLETEKFDVVLMDLQMPEINGFEATAMIRERERGTGTHVPIIALTAHALKGDRERCIDAGMDEYVAKPIEAQRLFEVIESAASGAAAEANNGRSHPSRFDEDAVLMNFDGDVELVRKLVDIFADSSDGQLSGIRDAIARGDCQAVELTSHSLKGAVAHFHAHAAAAAAARLEQIGRGTDLSDADAAFDTLETEIARLKQELAEFVEVNL